MNSFNSLRVSFSNADVDGFRSVLCWIAFVHGVTLAEGLFMVDVFALAVGWSLPVDDFPLELVFLQMRMVSHN